MSTKRYLTISYCCLAQAAMRGSTNLLDQPPHSSLIFTTIKVLHSRLPALVFSPSQVRSGALDLAYLVALFGVRGF